MIPTDLDSRLRAAEAVVRRAGRVAAEHFARRERLRIDRKGAQDLVSEADRACEDLIVASLAHLFPRDGFLGEERGLRNPGAAAVWVIDPIDGTHNFLTGIPFWCVSVGLVVDGKLVLGIIYSPLAGEFYSARRGGGAFLNGQPIKVSGETDLTRARICVGFSYRQSVAEHVRVVDEVLGAGCEYLRLGSGSLSLAYTAAGRSEQAIRSTNTIRCWAEPYPPDMTEIPAVSAACSATTLVFHIDSLPTDSGPIPNGWARCRWLIGGSPLDRARRLSGGAVDGDRAGENLPNPRDHFLTEDAHRALNHVVGHRAELEDHRQPH